MTLLDVATKGRSQRDSLLKIATGILTLEDVITEKRDLIREQSIIEINDEGVPMVSGFKDADYVELLQQQIEVLSNNRDELLGVIDEIEAAFGQFELQPMSMGVLDEKINEAQSRSEAIARKINRLAVRLLNERPALTLVELFANEELQTLEGSRAASIIEGNAEAQRLIKLKDQLLPLCADGGIISDAVFHPERAMINDPARLTELRSA